MDEYFCPHCNATLNLQSGFNPNSDYWKCTECGQILYGDTMPEGVYYPDVVWFCDNCGALLNKQSGFYDYCTTWYCRECGHANSINEDEIYDSEEEYRNKIEYECPKCGRSLNNQVFFNPNNNTHTCSWCNTRLEKDDDEYVVMEDVEEDDDNTSYNSSTYSESCSPSQASETQPQITSKRKKQYFGLAIMRLIIIFVLCGAFLYYEWQRMIPVGYSPDNLIGLEFNHAVELLENRGFFIINTKRVSDLKVKDIDKENLVTDIKILWSNDFNASSQFPDNSWVTITYHTLDTIPVPASSKVLKGQHYQDVITQFGKSGFINIKVKAKYDIVTGWVNEPGKVSSVSIDRNRRFDAEAKFRPDVEIVITYHELSKNKPRE